MNTAPLAAKRQREAAAAAARVPFIISLCVGLCNFTIVELTENIILVQ